MTKLGDKARELVSIAEAEIEKREITIVALHNEVEKLREELAAVKNLRIGGRSGKCENCAYRVIALKALEKEEQAAK